MFKKLLKGVTRPATAVRHGPIANGYEVVLHIGAPKTGSSAIQRFLNAHRDVLRRNGFHYPQHRVTGNGISAGHSSLTKACHQRRYQDARTIFNTWLGEARQQGLALLLSSEPFINLAQALATVIGGRAVRVIAYQRDIVDFLASEHNQLVKNAFEVRSFEDYILGRVNPFEKSPRLVKKPFSEAYAEWADYVGMENLLVRPYDTSLFQQHSIEQDFLHSLGIDPGDEFQFDSTPINVSYTHHALELKRMLNHVLDRGEEKLNRTIENQLQAFSQSAHGDSNLPIPLGSDAYKQLMAFLRSDYQTLEHTYLKQPLKKQHVLGENTIEQAKLKAVLEALCQHAGIARYLRRTIQAKLASRENLTYSVYRLAEMLQVSHLERYENRIRDGWFDEKQLGRMLEGGFDEADFLREIALVASQRGDLEAASALIDRAAALRPGGAAIAQLKAQIKALIDRKNSSGR